MRIRVTGGASACRHDAKRLLAKLPIACLIAVVLALALAYPAAYPAPAREPTAPCQAADDWLSDPDARWEAFLAWAESRRGKPVDWEMEAEVSKALHRLVDDPERLKSLGIKYGGHLGINYTIYVGLVDPTEEHERLVLEIMKPHPKIVVVFYEVNCTMWELEEALDRLVVGWEGLEAAGVPLCWADANEVTNRLEVGLKELKPEYMEAVREAVGKVSR